ncbi:MAG: iron chelate uptake ABC transporter family permease subunit, partial [Eudoraea sp.]
MQRSNTYLFPFLILFLVLLFCFVLNLSLGSVAIPFNETLKSLFGGTIENESWQYIIWNYRIPKAFTAILVGSGLS